MLSSLIEGLIEGFTDETRRPIEIVCWARVIIAVVEAVPFWRNPRSTAKSFREMSDTEQPRREGQRWDSRGNGTIERVLPTARCESERERKCDYFGCGVVGACHPTPVSGRRSSEPRRERMTKARRANNIEVARKSWRWPFIVHVSRRSFPSCIVRPARAPVFRVDGALVRAGWNDKARLWPMRPGFHDTRIPGRT